MKVVKRQIKNLFIRMKEEIDGEVLDALRSIGEHVNVNTVSKHIGYNWHTSSRHLNALTKDGLILRSGDNSRNYRYTIATAKGESNNG